MIQSIDRWRQSTWCCEPLQIKKKKSALLGISQYLKFFFFFYPYTYPPYAMFISSVVLSQKWPSNVVDVL